MLLDSFFKIESFESVENDYIYIVKLNKTHEIYKGHFPMQPIAPGVCLAQMIKELAQTSLNNKLKLKTARSIKFMAILNPNENEVVQIKMNIRTEMDKFDVRASCFSGEKTFFKIDATYCI